MHRVFTGAVFSRNLAHCGIHTQSSQHRSEELPKVFKAMAEAEHRVPLGLDVVDDQRAAMISCSTTTDLSHRWFKTMTTALQLRDPEHSHSYLLITERVWSNVAIYVT